MKIPSNLSSTIILHYNGTAVMKQQTVVDVVISALFNMLISDLLMFPLAYTLQ
jgi:hypothetical protein